MQENKALHLLACKHYEHVAFLHDGYLRNVFKLQYSLYVTSRHVLDVNTRICAENDPLLRVSHTIYRF